MLLRTSDGGLKGQSLVFRKNGPFTQTLFFRASAVIPRVPVPSGLSPLDTWNHSSIVVDSRISETRLATKTGNLLVEFKHCSAVVLFVHMYDLTIFLLKDFLISSLRRLAKNAACDSSSRIEKVFIGTTLAYPKTKAILVSFLTTERPRRKATEQSTT